MPIPDPAELNTLYQEWLEIPAERLPPNHYALLGLADFESDEALIESAARSRSAYLHQIAAGPQRKIVQEMLGQVAIARRTLMSAESRRAYDQSLRSPVASADNVTSTAPLSGHASSDNSHRGNVEVDQPDNTVESQSTTATGTAVQRRRHTAGDWKYHGISAAVLLTIVAIVFLVNRNPGGRRAAEARPQEMGADVRGSSLQSAGAERNADQDNESGAGRRAAGTTGRKASPQASRADGPPAQHRSPIAKRRDTGSGLGAGLGDKFGDVLSDIAKQGDEGMPAKAASSENRGKFRPLGGLSISPATTLPDSVDPIASLRAVAEFPGQLADRFECEQGFQWYEATDEAIRLVPNEAHTSFIIRDKQFTLTSGAAMAVSTSLSAGMRGETQVGFQVDGIRIGLRSAKNAIEVFARDRGDDVRRDLVDKIKTPGDSTTLSIQRDANEPDLFHWFVQSGETTRTGTIGVTSLAESAPVAVFVTASKPDPKRPLTLSGLKTSAGQP
ncbi:hypothetical protein Mal15_26390 [Stieleria maiorica]|uniref:J domain-containing protein n=1 Tax=Stieleria maiorica TaxID=2795974 RepID=A0A5B9MED4_9BACT|nr:hypothetical protein [Stieleria maiorica]QEF98586.1 hypothetical protein Mal15_26390 [Stieleria maiorica]